MKTILVMSVLVGASMAFAQTRDQQKDLVLPLKNKTVVVSDKNVSSLQQKPNFPNNPQAPSKSQMQRSMSARGSEGVGGGDLCEDRIQQIRDDIEVWIRAGGSKDLRLSSGMTIDQYNQSMMKALESTKVRCVKEGDSGYPVKVAGVPKVCRFDKSLFGSAKITCDENTFMNQATMSESNQYILVHHEYAGLAGIENPNGDVSTYNLSNQISAYLVDQVVKKLAVKSVTPVDTGWEPVASGSQVTVGNRLRDILERAKFSDCDISLQIPYTNDNGLKCANAAGISNYYGLILSDRKENIGVQYYPGGGYHDCQEGAGILMRKLSSGIQLKDFDDTFNYPGVVEAKTNVIYNFDPSGRNLLSVIVSDTWISQENVGGIITGPIYQTKSGSNSFVCHVK